MLRTIEYSIKYLFDFQTFQATDDRNSILAYSKCQDLNSKSLQNPATASAVPCPWFKYKSQSPTNI